MATNPYSWAARFSQNAQDDLTRSQENYNQALLSAFQEEAARQRPYAVMPAALAQANFDRQNAAPYKRAAEGRANQEWRQRRLFQHKLDMAEMEAENQSLGGLGGGNLITNDDGSKVFTTPSGRTVYVPPPE